jgi:hypothetical protein
MNKAMKGKRIKAGLAAAKARGVKLGNPRFETVRAEARAATPSSRRASGRWSRRCAPTA